MMQVVRATFGIILSLSTSSLLVQAAKHHNLHNPMALKSLVKNNINQRFKVDRRAINFTAETYSHHQENFQVNQIERGGASRSSLQSKSPIDTQKYVTMTKVALSTFIGIILFQQIHQNRHKLPSKEEIQNFAFDIATNIKGRGHIGIVYYVLGLACFEIFGISTCPVEISGGFVYGIKKGFIINLVGKLTGAMTAFVIGRILLSSAIRSKFLSPPSVGTGKGTSEISTSAQVIQLVQTSITEEPFKTALVLRFSMFPQLLKNLILSVLEPVNWSLFLFVTSMQVTPFTLLFTCLGYDSAQRLLFPDLKTNYILSGCFLVSTIYGIFGGTTITALWYHSKSKKLKAKK